MARLRLFKEIKERFKSLTDSEDVKNYLQQWAAGDEPFLTDMINNDNLSPNNRAELAKILIDTYINNIFSILELKLLRKSLEGNLSKVSFLSFDIKGFYKMKIGNNPIVYLNVRDITYHDIDDRIKLLEFAQSRMTTNNGLIGKGLESAIRMTSRHPDRDVKTVKEGSTGEESERAGSEDSDEIKVALREIITTWRQAALDGLLEGKIELIDKRLKAIESQSSSTWLPLIGNLIWAASVFAPYLIPALAAIKGASIAKDVAVFAVSLVGIGIGSASSLSKEASKSLDEKKIGDEIRKKLTTQIYLMGDSFFNQIQTKIAFEYYLKGYNANSAKEKFLELIFPNYIKKTGTNKELDAANVSEHYHQYFLFYIEFMEREFDKIGKRLGAEIDYLYDLPAGAGEEYTRLHNRSRMFVKVRVNNGGPIKLAVVQRGDGSDDIFNNQWLYYSTPKEWFKEYREPNYPFFIRDDFVSDAIRLQYAYNRLEPPTINYNSVIYTLQ